ncbi:hypothetical protein [Pandoraea anapnoica]|nr:hypothetical protein [Pandoraea anapnoica]
MRFGVYSFLGGAVGGLFLAKAWQYQPTSSQDWSGWAQAVAAAAAFGGTIWVATRDLRERRSSGHASARLTAVGLHYRMINVVATLEAVQGALREGTVVELDPGRYAYIATELEHLTISSREEQLALLPLFETLALALGVAGDQATSVIDTMRVCAATQNVPSYDKIKAARVSKTAIDKAVELTMFVRDELLDISIRESRYMRDAMQKRKPAVSSADPGPSSTPAS